MTIQQALEQAARCEQAGDFLQAEGICRQILAACPEQPQALHRLGVVTFKSGQAALAIELLRRSIRGFAGAREAWHPYFDLARVFDSLSRREEAIEALQHSLRLHPDNALGFSNLGSMLQSQGRFDEAIAACRRAIAIQPGLPQAHNNLGNALRQKGDLNAAIQSLRLALELKPAYPEALNNLGVALHTNGEFEHAVECLRRAIAVHPEYAESWMNLGNAFFAADRQQDAVNAFRHAIKLRPGYAGSYGNLGAAMMLAGEFDEAIQILNRAIELAPDFAEAYFNRACAEFGSGIIRRSFDAMQHALTLDQKNRRANDLLLMIAMCDPTMSASDIRIVFEGWDDAMRGSYTLLPAPDNDRSPDRLLRIGYVSPDMVTNSTSTFFEGLLAEHDQSQVETYCYADLRDIDSTSQRLQAAASHWVRTERMTDRQLAKRIRDDRIDILVDLCGHARDNRLPSFAAKPAPIQITYLGIQYTTGLKAMDYLLTDMHVDPPGKTESHSTEALLRVPDSMVCFRPPDSGPDVAALPATKTGIFTFGSYNELRKINEAVLDCWASLLCASSGSRLRMVARGLQNASIVNRLTSHFAAAGIAPDRIEFLPAMDFSDYLQSHEKVDVLLDPFPVNGLTVTCHSLWMGVPPICLAGNTHAGRLGVSLLTNLGLTQFIARDYAEYVEIAQRLAENPSELTHLRATMRERMRNSPLMNPRKLARDVEALYRQAWRKWCNS